MHQYVYWYHPDKELEEDEIIKPINDPIRHVVANIHRLERSLIQYYMIVKEMVKIVQYLERR